MPLHVSFSAPAKINLSLDIVGRRPDGYHLLATVMQSIDLADQVTITVFEQHGDGEPIHIRCTQVGIPRDKQNTVWKAAALFCDAAALDLSPASGFGLRIDLDKRVPAAAGLGGGSSDAAAVLRALDFLFPGRVGPSDLDRLALEVGADVPFCLHGGTLFCEGIGERLTDLPPWPGLPLLLCAPSSPLLTRQVFAAYRESHMIARPDTAAVLRAVRTRNLTALADSSANVLEAVSIAQLPQLSSIKANLLDCGAVMAQMSGSGPAVYGLFASDEACRQAADAMKHRLPDDVRLFACHTVAAGPQQLRDGG
ncbi:MAG: 4-(cytidine 5'-diphospho)-2-C-methyl-D-erythritol kinase [Eubacteriales bacterium]|nr:4-(cytidine 5'-diphospho)-2-C-methyl-D-erythritol kinase [Clostridiales bacterium]MDD4139080.1 4-(cytidine 5'-diphospho)-2-C-methyl-D-erythritol kinase [Eubacteriales bacterium]MDD4743208.1 4-(cytidine 5'-diphospho)-2-C-methyl-D-erythritol kinase [Eubacteriales bacterium]